MSNWSECAIISVGKSLSVGEKAMPSAVTVDPVTTSRQRRAFLRFPWRIYEDDPNWMPPTLSERAARLDPGQNPLFQHGEAEPFIAIRDAQVMGTIAAAVDHRAHQLRNEQIAFFGFYRGRGPDALIYLEMGRA
jgi:hypothetical protein